MASIRKLPSGHYRLRWRDPDGVEHGVTLRRHKEALQQKADVESQASRGIYRDPAAGRQLFGKYLKTSLAGSVELRASTRALYETIGRVHVLPSLGRKALAGVQPADLRKLYADLVSDGVGIPTVEKVHQLISRVLAQAVDDGILQVNAASRVRPPRATRQPPRVLTEKEVGLIVLATGWLTIRPGREDPFTEDSCKTELNALTTELEAGDQPPVAVIARHAQLSTALLVALAAYTGLRFGELAALRWGRLKFDDRPPRLEVVEAVSEVAGKVQIGPTKTGTRRSVPLPRAVAERLRLARRADGPEDLVFTTPRGLPWSRTRFRSRVWVPAVKLSGINPPPNFHDLRHTYAGWLIARGAHPKVIAEYLGHTSIRTTLDIYGELMPGLDLAVMERFDEVAAAHVARMWHERPSAGSAGSNEEEGKGS